MVVSRLGGTWCLISLKGWGAQARHCCAELEPFNTQRREESPGLGAGLKSFVISGCFSFISSIGTKPPGGGVSFNSTPCIVT